MLPTLDMHRSLHARASVGFVLLRCVAVSAWGGDTHRHELSHHHMTV